MSRAGLLFATLLALGVAPSCRFRRAPKTPPVTTPVPPSPPKTEAKPVVLPSPPAVAPTDSTVKAPPATEVRVPPAPPKPAKRANQPRTRPPAAVKPDAEPAEPPKTEAQPPAQPPAAQLGELISDRQRSELNRQIDQSLERARQNLARLAARSITPAEAEARQRIESFIKQAEATRKDDPLTAKNLAERAEVLSQDLARN